jgi:hypothetical protein
MKIAILTPIFDNKPHSAFCDGLSRTFRANPDVEWLRLPGCADVSLARNTLVAKGLATEAEIFVFVDADIGFQPADIRIVTAPIALGKGHLVCGIYPKKQVGIPDYPVRFFEEDVSEEKGYIGPVRAFGDPEQKYGRCEFAGAGFMAMSRTLLEAASKEAKQYCPGPGYSNTNKLEERQAMLFHPAIELEKRQEIPRFEGEDVTGFRVLRKTLESLECVFQVAMFAFETTLTHRTAEFAFGGGIPDVGMIARRHAFGNEVMRRAAKGDPMERAEFERRSSQILQRSMQAPAAPSKTT